MRLSELIPAQPALAVDPEITAITDDSRRVSPGALFVAVRGATADGHHFIADAIDRGAAALILERDPHASAPGAWVVDRCGRAVPIVALPSSRTALAESAARFYGEPARGLHLIGFTGTFGKTTTSEVLRGLLEAGGRRVGVMGSLGARCGSFSEPPGELTTPAPVDLHRLLRRLGDAGADAVIMEVTTHALRLGRVHGLRFQDALIAAILPGEHTDFHHSYDDYVAAKRQILDYLEEDAVLAHDADNIAARELAASARDLIARTVRTAGLTIDRPPLGGAADVALEQVVLDEDGALITVRGERLRSSLLGRGNVRNVGLALTLAMARGLPLGAARGVLRALRPLRRRMERFTLAGRTVLDDTAAHPDSFRSTFEVAAILSRRRLVVVYAVRGRRGQDINRRNALALADLIDLQQARPFIVTAAADVTGPADEAAPDEIDAAREAFQERGTPFIWHDTLADAAREAARQSAEGDLVVLIGAQGMNEGARLLREAMGVL